MQRTAEGVIDHQSFPEGPAVVGTGCAHSEEFRAAARQHHTVTPNLSLNHSSFGNAVDSYSGCEIRYNSARHMSVLRND
jgi:hypothetical protein